MDRRVVSGVLFLTGALLLAATMLVPWYLVSGGNGSTSASETFSPFGVEVTSSASSHTSYTYSNAWLPTVGVLYFVSALIVVAGAILGVVAGFFLITREDTSSPKVAFALAVAALFVAAAAPTVLLAAQPSAVCTDASHFSSPFGAPPSFTGTSGPSCTWEFYVGNGTWFSAGFQHGPQDSFVGAASQNLTYQSWGPESGWYFAIAGAGAMLVATILRWGRGSGRRRSVSRPG